MKNMIISKYTCINALVVILLIVSSTAQAETDDEYLKMLEGEATGVSLDKSGQIKQKKAKAKKSKDGITKTNWKWSGNLEGDRLPDGLKQKEFATLLKQRYYGTFVFYRKLNSVDQEAVYSKYTKASPAELDPIRKNILNLLKR